MNALDPNPRLPRFAQASLYLVSVALLLGVALLVPSLTIPRWPWDIKPFNASFIGAFYLAGWLGAVYAASVGRNSPAAAFFREAAVFTVMATLTSFLHRATFLPERRMSVAIWWVAYIVFALALTRNALVVRPEPGLGRPLPEGIRRLLGLYAAVTFLYGLALLLAPAAATSFWPWPVDAFHSQVYSGIFFSGTAVLLGLRQLVTGRDLTMAGLLQTVLGLGAVLGTWRVNLTAQRVDWSAGGTWLWLAMFGGMALVGMVMMVKARDWGAEGG